MITKRHIFRGLALILCFISLAVPALAQEAKLVSRVLFTNVNVFDGVNEQLAEGMSVLVEGNKIAKIAKSIPTPDEATVIDGGGRTLIPGLIDVHWQTYDANIPVSTLATADMSEVAIAGLLGSKETLMRGFTTVRDIGGNPFAVKKHADDGSYPGRR